MRRDQLLSDTAWSVVRAVKGSDVAGQARTRLMGLPSMLQGSGVVATMAFLKAKAGPGPGRSPLEQAYERVFDALGRHVAPADRHGDPLGWLAACDTTTLRRASVAAREFATWLRRAAEAELPKPEQGEEQGGEEAGVAERF
jgi:CRISPR type III-B/RAMP module-associated protein Cmr5